jgi:hypothetical protein
MNCEYCGSPAHVWYDCRKKPDGWKPERMAADAAGRVGYERQGTGYDPHAAGPELVGRDKAPPAKRGRGRPKTIKDMRAYKAQKAREYRAAKREAKP